MYASYTEFGEKIFETDIRLQCHFTFCEWAKLHQEEQWLYLKFLVFTTDSQLQNDLDKMQ